MSTIQIFHEATVQPNGKFEVPGSRFRVSVIAAKAGIRGGN
jgi:hypothetical protein